MITAEDLYNAYRDARLAEGPKPKWRELSIDEEYRWTAVMMHVSKATVAEMCGLASDIATEQGKRDRLDGLRALIGQRDDAKD